MGCNWLVLLLCLCHVLFLPSCGRGKNLGGCGKRSMPTLISNKSTWEQALDPFKLSTALPPAYVAAQSQSQHPSTATSSSSSPEQPFSTGPSTAITTSVLVVGFLINNVLALELPLSYIMYVLSLLLLAFFLSL